MRWKVTFLIVVALSSPARAYWRCDGLVTSNNSCIGSESNVDSWDNHEPFYTDEQIDERTTRDIKRQRTTKPAARPPAAQAPVIQTPLGPVTSVPSGQPPAASSQQDATSTTTQTQTSTQTAPTLSTTTTTTTTTTKTTTTKQRDK